MLEVTDEEEQLEKVQELEILFRKRLKWKQIM